MNDELKRLADAQMESTWGDTSVQNGEITESELGDGPVSSRLKEIGLSVFQSTMGSRSGHFEIQEQSTTGNYVRPVICIRDDEGAYIDSYSLLDDEKSEIAGMIATLKKEAQPKKSISMGMG